MFTEKMKFGSVSDEMLVNNEGSHDMELPNVSTGNPNTIHKSYANIAASVESIIDNKLMSIPTDYDELGNEYGLKDVIENDSGMFFFKFHHEEGLNHVLDNGPWMVNNKPLVVQKWDVNMNIERTEPDTLPLW
ncbi:zinc knuckle CX2CX4HX4C containing protein, partial [Tanacetum coccineum]